MELPKRKPQRLKDYDYSQSNAYFITICTRNRCSLLGKTVGNDAHIVPSFIELSEYGNIADEHINNINTLYGATIIDKYIIMPNHIHLIIILADMMKNGTMKASFPTNARIPSIIRSFKILVSKKCGEPIWQKSFHDHIIRNEDEYHRIWQYIDKNPMKWSEDKYYCGKD